MKYLIWLTFVIGASPALAQDEEPEEEPIILSHPVRDDAITVVGTGTVRTVWDTAQSVSIVSANEIAAVQGPDIARVLERLPGVTFSRNGGLGSVTGVFVRGASSEQLLVLIDGVRAADVAAPGGGFDFGTLLAGGISKIELLRGSNSVVWGSDAIGGVLAVTSDARDGVAGSLEYGANDSLYAVTSAGLSGEGFAFGASGGYARSDGISAFAGGNESDPFRQWHVALRGRGELGNGLWLGATGRYADSRVAFDGYPPPTYTFADTGEYQTTRQGSGRVGLDYYGDALTLRAGLALSDTRRAYFDPAFGSGAGFETEGRSWRADLGGRAEIASGWSMDFGADSEWTRFATTFDPHRAARLSSGHALLRYEDGREVQLSAGVRLDDHDRFGSHWTFGANGSLALTDGWRLRASYGEGFKAPTLYQLYGYGGNVALEPEQSRSFDLAIDHGDRNAGSFFAATLFRRDSRNLIDYISPAGYFNTARARAEGLELEARVHPDERLAAYATYSFTKATNRLTGKDLARRPRHAVSLGADWRTPLADLTLGADLRLVSDSFDDAGNFVPLDGYALVTLRASLPLDERLDLFARIENLGNVGYQTAAGYGAPGRAAYAGARVRW